MTKERNLRKRTAKRIRRKEGDVVQINLGKRQFAYGRVLYDPLLAFYDFRSSSPADVETVISKPVAFVIAVMHEPIKSGRWPVIGNAPLEEKLTKAFRFCRQDALNSKNLSITWMVGRGPEEVVMPATFEKCKGLEIDAVWYDYHVEDRLRDHFAGRPCKWVESLKIKKPTS